MNPNSRTIKVIETSLARLESASTPAPAGAVAAAESTALEALGLLDEIRRLERKWREQVAAGSPRRKHTDYGAMEGWCRRWMLATGRLADGGLSQNVAAPLRTARESVEQDLSSEHFRRAAQAMRAGPIS